MPSKKPKKKDKSTPARMLVENIECLGIAIVMALVLKYFLIEAFKIPTGSMQPTIIGDAKIGIFDRVLVNKLSYLIGKPRRWDVVVFKYPLDLSKNYIKRLIGLPGEEIEIAGGEIYVRTRDGSGELGPSSIARKPASVRNSVMRRVFPGPVEGDVVSKFFEITGAEELAGTVRILSEEPALLRTRRPVLDHYHHGYHLSWISGPPQSLSLHAVGDLRISLEASLEAGGELTLAIAESGREHEAFLPVLARGAPAGSAWLRSHVGGIGEEGGSGADPLEHRLEEVKLTGSEAHLVTFMNVDDTLILEIDGDEVGRLEYEGPKLDQNRKNEIRIQVSGSAGTISEITVDRDNFYRAHENGGWGPSEPIRVPADAFFVMGDNTQNSHDGRTWQFGTFHYDGKEIEGNWFPQRRPDQDDANPLPLPGNKKLFRDKYGEPHELPADLRVGPIRQEHFVRRDYLLGKAIAVFWPVPPFSRTLRWKLIR
ncbi:MAG: signal peptidase I [Planctomycetota bacterium]